MIVFGLLMNACRQTPEAIVHKTFEQVYPIDPSAAFSLTNFNGSVIIRGSDVPELRVQADITATSPEKLNETTIEIKARDDRASIATNFPREKGRVRVSGKVDYTLQVPATIKISQLDVENGRISIEGMHGPELNANVVDGSLSVQNCFANARLSVSSGSLELSYDRWTDDLFRLAAHIIQGNARVVVPTSASLHLLADAPGGKVINHLTEMVELNGRSVSRIDTKVGTHAGPELHVRAVMGDIEIAPVKTLAKE